MKFKLALKEFLQTELNRTGASIEISDADSLFISGKLDSIAAVRLLLFLESQAEFQSPIGVQDLSQIDSVDKILSMIKIR